MNSTKIVTLTQQKLARRKIRNYNKVILITRSNHRYISHYIHAQFNLIYRLIINFSHLTNYLSWQEQKYNWRTWLIKYILSLININQRSRNNTGRYCCQILPERRRGSLGTWPKLLSSRWPRLGWFKLFKLLLTLFATLLLVIRCSIFCYLNRRL